MHRPPVTFSNALVLNLTCLLRETNPIITNHFLRLSVCIIKFVLLGHEKETDVRPMLPDHEKYF